MQWVGHQLHHRAWRPVWSGSAECSTVAVNLAADAIHESCSSHFRYCCASSDRLWGSLSHATHCACAMQISSCDAPHGCGAVHRRGTQGRGEGSAGRGDEGSLGKAWCPAERPSATCPATDGSPCARCGCGLASRSWRSARQTRTANCKRSGTGSGPSLPRGRPSQAARPPVHWLHKPLPAFLIPLPPTT